jgi:hypothetical protein
MSFFFKNEKKLDYGKNGIDFSSNIDFAKRSLAKVLHNRIGKLSTFLDTNDTQLHVETISKITIKRVDTMNEASEKSCSSSFMLHNSNKFAIDPSINKLKCKFINTQFTNSTQLNINTRIHSKQKRFK